MGGNEGSPPTPLSPVEMGRRTKELSPSSGPPPQKGSRYGAWIFFPPRWVVGCWGCCRGTKGVYLKTSSGDGLIVNRLLRRKKKCQEKSAWQPWQRKRESYCQTRFYANVTKYRKCWCFFERCNGHLFMFVFKVYVIVFIRAVSQFIVGSNFNGFSFWNTGVEATCASGA